MPTTPRRESDAMQTVMIHTDRPYAAHAGKGLLCRTGELIGAVTASRRCVLVSDTNVAPLYGDRVRAALTESGFTVHTTIIPAGEQHKTLATCGRLLSFFAQSGLTRSDFVVALGGGVVGDIAGFAAAVYQRGIDFVQIPTTLLSACDASVGGKTAVDLPEGKNLAGAFHQPILVLCDTDTFDTLPRPVFAEGMAEVIKHALIADGAFFRFLTNENIRENIVDVVCRNIAIKAAVVAEDEREHGRRKILNFGHTLGHAIEKCSGYTVSHGDAVAIGMVLAVRAAEKLGYSPAGTLPAVIDLLSRFDLPTVCPYSAEELFAAATADKKRSGDSIDIVILKKIGKADTLRLAMDGLSAFTEAAL